MRIDANINGMEVMTNDVDGLLHIMEIEHCQSCIVETFVTGMPMTKMNMTIDDVKEWSRLNHG